MSASQPQLRFNLRALKILLALLILAIPIVWMTVGLPNRSVRSGVLDQAKVLVEAGKTDLAVRHLERYLASQPGDVKVVDALADILRKNAYSPSQILEAAKYHQMALRLDGDGVNRNETRRQLAELYLRFGDQARQSAAQIDPTTITGRYLTAEQLTNQLLVKDPKLSDRLLHARALEGLGSFGNEEALNQSVTEYETVLGAKADAKKLLAANEELLAVERLANLYRERLKKPDDSLRVLDAFVEANPQLAKAYLLRFVHFSRIKEKERAQKELDEAIRLAPDDPDIVLIAAGEALKKGEPATAREFLKKLPETANANLRVRLLRGMVDFAEQNDSDAISLWRNNLILSGGTDVDMTWWLAYFLLNLEKHEVEEAQPMITQFQRIAADERYQPRTEFLLGLKAYRLALRASKLEEKGSAKLAAMTTVAIDHLKTAKLKIGDEFQDKVLMALGKCHELTGDYEQALTFYRQAYERFSDAPAPRLAAVSLLLNQMKSPERAIAELNKGIALAPTDPQLRMAMAGLLMKQQVATPLPDRQWGAVDAALAKVKEVAPNNPNLLLLMADRLTLSGQAGQANDILRKRSQETPESIPLRLAFAENLSRTGQLAEALSVVQQGKGDASGTPDNRIALSIAESRILSALRRGTAAARVLIDAAAQLPPEKQARIAEALGKLYEEQGNNDEAYSAYLKWSKSSPSDPYPSLAMMRLALDRKDSARLADAAATLRKAIDLKNAAEAGNAGEKPRDGVKAAATSAEGLDPKTMIDELLATSPNFAPALIVRGRLFEDEKKIPEAIAAYEKAKNLGDPVAIKRLMELLLSEKKFDELEALATPQNPRFHRALAETFFQARQVDRALRQVKLAAETDSDTVEACNWQAQMYERLGQPAQAEATLRSLVNRKPTELDSWLTLLAIQASHKDSAGIKATLAELKSKVKSSDPALLDARCARAIGDHAAAEKAYRDAIAGNPEDGVARIEAATYMQQQKRVIDAAQFLKGAPTDSPAYKAVARQIALAMSGELARGGNPGESLKLWQAAWDLLGEDRQDEADAEDRLIRAILVSRSPDAERRDKAPAMLEKLAADLPADSLTAAAAREYLAKILLLAGNAKKAAEVASVTAALGNEAPAIALYAEALLHAKDLDESEKQLDRLKKLRSGDPTEAFVRARLIRARAGSNQAEALEKAYLDRAKESAAEALPFGQEAISLLLDPASGGSSEQVSLNAAVAERIGREMASTKPGLSWIPAKALLSQKKYLEALALAPAALESNELPDRIEGGRIALVAASAGGPEALAKADELMTAAAAREPRQLDQLSVLGMIRHKQGRFDDEIKLYREILALSPVNGAAANNLAWALSEGASKPDEGLKFIDKAIALTGPLPQFLDTRGAILTRLGRYDDAIKDLETAGNQSPIHLFHLARAYQKAGRVDDAKKTISLAKQNGLIEDRLEPFERPELKNLLEL